MVLMSDHQADLKRRHFPTLNPEYIGLIEYPGGWRAYYTARLSPRRARWTICTASFEAGDFGCGVRPDLLYKSPERALKALKRRIRDMSDHLTEVLS